MDRLTILEITEDELEKLEQASPESIFFNLGIFTLSVAISFSVTLATTKIESDRAFYVFVILVVIGYLAGCTFAILWLRARRAIKSVSARIRARIPAEGIQEGPA